MKDYLLFYVNGKEIIERQAEPEWTLGFYLRNKLRLTGTKLSCGVGGCGSCTIIICQLNHFEKDKIEYSRVNSCLYPLCSVDGLHILTIEGLSLFNKSNEYSIEKRFEQLFSSQCGYCTPGIIMSLYGILTSNSDQTFPTIQDIEDDLDGNLCRCTGYRSILDAAKTLTNDFHQLYFEKNSSLTSTTYDKCIQYSNKSPFNLNELIYPDQLRNNVRQSLYIKGNESEWYCPMSLNELLELRQKYPGEKSKIVCGNTTIEIERKFQKQNPKCFISIKSIEQLKQIQINDNQIFIGCAVTFTEILNKFNHLKHENKYLKTFCDQIKQLGSTQIRNVASIGGNLLSSSSNSDIIPILLVLNTSIILCSLNENNQRKILLEQFYVDHPKLSLKENEILYGIEIPLENNENRIYLCSYKQSRRRQNSRAIVNAAFKLELKQSNSNDLFIKSILMAFGGISSKIILEKQVQNELIDLPWNKQTIHKAFDLLVENIHLNDSTQQGQIKYRKTLVQSFLLKFYLYVCNEERQSSDDFNNLNINRGISHGQQTIPKINDKTNSIESSLTHRSSYYHSRGQSIFVNDITSDINTHYAALVLSTKPYAKIKNINIEKASKVDGFVSFVSANDVPGPNKMGDIESDEEIFASSIVNCVGSIIGLVVCQTEYSADKASKLVEIEYELLSPTILSIDDAIEHQSYFGDEIILEQGSLDKAFNDNQHILEETFYIGGQEHFYMETNSCFVVPSNDGQRIDLYLGTQSPTAAQQLIAFILNRQLSQVTCHVKQIGGAFGGKESRSLPICACAAVAAVKIGHPVRINLDRYVDMCVTGHRHPFKIKYKVAFNDQGRFNGIDIQMWNNAGCTLDASEAVMQLSMLHMCNCYQFHNIRIRGRVCKTHLPSNTAFRGFGGPQSILSCENLLEHVAHYLKKDPYDIRLINLFKEGDQTHYGQILEQWNIPRIIDELTKSSDFIQRKENIDLFNKNSKYIKRGISFIPAKFGIGFTVNYLNQAGSLVNIYRDGSVLISHGGVELGQGLHTKIISIAAQELNCDVDKIRIHETSTDQIPNTSPTGGSVSTDLNGMAVKRACQIIRQRLNELNCENLSWEDLISKAYFSQVDLSARGFYTTPNMFDADFKNNKAKFNYFTQGAAVSEVELDVLTGNWFTRRVDILMDVGKSLNPQIDIGQIEGAFMQGVGLFTMEELIWGDNHINQWIKPGQLFSSGPDTYKIPSFNDVPVDFRVSILSDSLNPRSIYSSKGIGEPPILLGSSVFFALKQACYSYRYDQNLYDYLKLNSPATVERLRMACVDQLTHRVTSDKEHLFYPDGSF